MALGPKVVGVSPGPGLPADVHQRDFFSDTGLLHEGEADGTVGEIGVDEQDPGIRGRLHCQALQKPGIIAQLKIRSCQAGAFVQGQGGDGLLADDRRITLQPEPPQPTSDSTITAAITRAVRRFKCCIMFLLNVICGGSSYKLSI